MFLWQTVHFFRICMKSEKETEFLASNPDNVLSRINETRMSLINEVHYQV